MSLPEINIFTDGSLKGKWGAWAYVFELGGSVILENSGRIKTSSEQPWTSVEMELHAAIQALQSLPLGVQAIVFTDSRILVDAVTFQFDDWKKWGWKKKNGRPIPSVDLFRKIDFLLQDRTVRWKWVRSHAGNLLNERCDELCIQARELA